MLELVPLLFVLLCCAPYALVCDRITAKQHEAEVLLAKFRPK